MVLTAQQQAFWQENGYLVVEHVFGADEVVMRGHRPAQRQVTVSPAVYSDLVTVVGDVGSEAWRLRYLGTEQEEGRAEAALPEQLQEQRGCFEIGTIVECQRHVVGDRLAGQEREQRQAH